MGGVPVLLGLAAERRNGWSARNMGNGVKANPDGGENEPRVDLESAGKGKLQLHVIARGASA